MWAAARSLRLSCALALLAVGCPFRTMDMEVDLGDVATSSAVRGDDVDEVTTSSTSGGHKATPRQLGSLLTDELAKSGVDVSGVRVAADGRIVAAPTEATMSQRTDDAYHEQTHVALALPRSLVVTEAELRAGELEHFLQHPEFVKHLKKEKLRLPPNFAFALWVLYQENSIGKPHGDSLWRAWVAYHFSARTGADSLVYWSSDELEELEEPPLLESTRTLSEALEEAYTQLVRPLMKLFPTFFPPGTVDLQARPAPRVVAAAATLLHATRLQGSKRVSNHASSDEGERTTALQRGQACYAHRYIPSHTVA